jgi:hypothetical protein
MNEQKIEQFWRDATAEDVAKVMKGEKVEARFRDEDYEEWRDGEFLGGLRAFRSIPLAWIDLDGVQWAQCQVYEPQQWWLDKPDPGEGYRLLEKFPAEDLQPGDEWFEPAPFERGWKVSHNERQADCLWYRRRIEPNNPEKLDSLPCLGFPKGWTDLSVDEPRLASDAYWSLGANDWVIIGDARLEYANRDKWPAIRQVENWRCMMLMEGCFYMLPNGHGIKVTKQGFEVF